jgi:hypothetical protein
VKLTAANTAIVIDSTADFPGAGARFSNWRVVPLYVRFGDESYRDYVELAPAAFYERLRLAEQTPSTSQPTPGDFQAAYEALSEYERILSVHIAGELSGTIEIARTAARLLETDRVRTIPRRCARTRRGPEEDGSPHQAERRVGAGDDARPGRRRARGPRHRRLLLVRGRHVRRSLRCRPQDTPQGFLD